MKSIKLLIDIPQDQYEIICKSDNTAIAQFVSKETMMHSIKNGVHIDIEKLERLNLDDELY